MTGLLPAKAPGQAESEGSTTPAEKKGNSHEQKEELDKVFLYYREMCEQQSPSSVFLVNTVGEIHYLVAQTYGHDMMQYVCSFIFHVV